MWDGRAPNARCPKEDHPVAGQPAHRELAREIVWWRCRHPGVSIYLIKKDVAEAFKWLHVHLEDLAGFGGATSFEGDYWGIRSRVVAAYLFRVVRISGANGWHSRGP